MKKARKRDIIKLQRLLLEHQLQHDKLKQYVYGLQRQIKDLNSQLQNVWSEIHSAARHFANLQDFVVKRTQKKPKLKVVGK
jgi:hypothetical protein